MTINDLDLSKSYTYADYLTWQFDEYVELIKGKVYRMSPAPMRRHQYVSGKIFNLFTNFLDGKPCQVYSAPFDVRFVMSDYNNESITTVVQPDVCVVCDSNKLDDYGCIGAPDLIVEIISKGSAKKDLDDKFHLYEYFGVKEYWVVFPTDKFVSVYELYDGLYKLRADYEPGQNIPVGIFEGFEIDATKIFSEI